MNASHLAWIAEVTRWITGVALDSTSAGSQPSTAPVEASMDGPEDDGFNELALRLFRFQYESVAVYRRWCEMRAISPTSVETWTQIPFLPIDAFKEYPVTCLPEVARKAHFLSSGTTGSDRSRHFHCPESLALYDLSLSRWFLAQRWSASGVRKAHVISLTPNPSQVPASSLIHMFERIGVHSRTGATQFVGEVDTDPSGTWRCPIDRLVAAIEDVVAQDAPVLLLGTAFSFVHMLDAFGAQGPPRPLPPGSLVLETGGYKGRSRSVPRDELHQWISEALDVPSDHIATEYGMSELSSQAYPATLPASAAGDSGATFRWPPWARFRIVSPETGRPSAPGEVGLLQVLDLANVCSVAALQTADLAIERDGGFQLVGRHGAAPLKGCSLMATETG